MKTIIFIDGNNFYYRLKFLTQGIKNISLLAFNYTNFCKWLAGKNDLVEIRYYIGAVRIKKNNPKSAELHANQQRLFRILQKQNIIITIG